MPEYVDYINDFLIDLAIKLLKNTNINKHVIEFVEDKQSSYGPIYHLNVMEQETLKTYIETDLNTKFIWPSQFPTNTPILFDKNSDSRLYLCINY